MSGPPAAFFRVRMEFLTNDEAEAQPAVNGVIHHTLNVAASDAEAAIAAVRAAVRRREGYVPECVRVLSVEFLGSVNVLAIPAEARPTAAARCTQPA